MKITASFGISTVSDTVIPAIELINLADQKLYEAKKSGRNKVVLDFVSLKLKKLGRTGIDKIWTQFCHYIIC
ncbi:GGDEF domain-containing protein [Caldicellulosiruptor acetigenus]|uniref:GGDEF domain-containing protein n=1 Tax=Caldicellulosiruptor acetigenus TaxID=301953 RepID=UPI0009FF99C5